MLNACIFINIALKFKCYISNSKLALSECNGGYLSAIAVIVFMLHEVKQGIVFFGTPIYIYIYMKINVVYRKFECRKDIHYKTQTGTSCEKCNSEAFRLGI